MENKLNCIIVHGCTSDKKSAMNPETRTYDKHWIPWLKKELLKRNIKTETPLMPTPWEPDYEAYKKEFEKYSVNENTVLVGHTGGCAFLVRWLGESKQEIKKLILVAPWKVPNEGDPQREKFYTYAIDESIRKRVDKIIMLTSDNEGENGKKSLKTFYRALLGKIIELKGKGYYTMKDMGTDEFPELLEEILR